MQLTPRECGEDAVGEHRRVGDAHDAGVRLEYRSLRFAIQPEERRVEEVLVGARGGQQRRRHRREAHEPLGRVSVLVVRCGGLVRLENRERAHEVEPGALHRSAGRAPREPTLLNQKRSKRPPVGRRSERGVRRERLGNRASRRAPPFLGRCVRRNRRRDVGVERGGCDGRVQHPRCRRRSHVVADFRMRDNRP